MDLDPPEEELPEIDDDTLAQYLGIPPPETNDISENTFGITIGALANYAIDNHYLIQAQEETAFLQTPEELPQSPLPPPQPGFIRLLPVTHHQPDQPILTQQPQTQVQQEVEVLHEVRRTVQVVNLPRELTRLAAAVSPQQTPTTTSATVTPPPSTSGCFITRSHLHDAIKSAYELSTHLAGPSTSKAALLQLPEQHNTTLSTCQKIRKRLANFQATKQHLKCTACLRAPHIGSLCENGHLQCESCTKYVHICMQCGSQNYPSLEVTRQIRIRQKVNRRFHACPSPVCKVRNIKTAILDHINTCNHLNRDFLNRKNVAVCTFRTVTDEHESYHFTLSELPKPHIIKIPYPGPYIVLYLHRTAQNWQLSAQYITVRTPQKPPNITIEVYKASGENTGTSLTMTLSELIDDTLDLSHWNVSLAIGQMRMQDYTESKITDNTLCICRVTVNDK
jgi:hypothetical protein